MRITFYGGAGEVGRSCILLEEGKRNLMMDCGIKLGEKTEYPLIDDSELKRIHDIAITHAHLDHAGYLPHVYSKKAKPRIWMTKPTRDLIGVLLPDYHRLHYKEKETRKLFSIKDVNGILQDAKIVEPQQPVNADFNISFHNAGHIMGSSMIKIEEAGGIIYSGDICMRKTRVLEPAKSGLEAKTLILETTYGRKDEIIPSYKDSAAKLIKSINQTLKEGGHVIIPSFAVGRAQEVLMLLDDYMRSGALTQSKIYIEGMIGKVMRIYRHNAYYANEDIKKRILMSEDDPFKSEAFAHSRSKEKKDVLKEPCIIVSTSGMLSGGPVMFYLEKLGNDPKNKMIFVGYQAPGTRGRKVLEGEKKIQIGEKVIDIKMKIENVRMSGHADYNELIQFVRSIKGLKKIFLVHGEETDLAPALEKKYEVIVPRLLESYGI
jgi:predicted metal-dependent RNase